MGGDEDAIWAQYKSGNKIWYAPNKFEAYGDEEVQAVMNCLQSGWLAPGPLTEEFEQKVAVRFGKSCGVMVNSGSSANMLALLAAGVSKGDEVLTPACTFSTTVSPICQIGAIPVFVDVEVGTYVPSVDAIACMLTERTKAIFLPNLIGSKPDWKGIRDLIRRKGYSAVLIEDSCDTITHTPESDIAVASFYASHVITAAGGGGMVMFNDLAQRRTALMYRDWGRVGDNREDPTVRFAYQVDSIEYDFKFLYGVRGYNFKSTELNVNESLGWHNCKNWTSFFFCGEQTLKGMYLIYKVCRIWCCLLSGSRRIGWRSPLCTHVVVSF